MALPDGFDVDVPALRVYADDLANYAGQTRRFGQLIGEVNAAAGAAKWGIVGLFTEEKFHDRVGHVLEFVAKADEFVSGLDDRVRAAADGYDDFDATIKAALDAINKDVEESARGASVTDATSDLYITPADEWAAFRAPRQLPGVPGDFIEGASETISQFKEIPDNNAEAAVAATGFWMAEAGSFVYSCIDTVGDIAENPIEALVGLGVEFLIEVVRPIQDAIHYVSGDPNELEDRSGQLGDIADAIEAMSQNLVQTGDVRLAGWRGASSRAAKKRMAEFSEGMDGLAERVSCLSELLEASSIVMAVIEDVIKSILTEFITWLIMLWLPALAAAVVSFGSSTAAATVYTFIETGKTVAETTEKVDTLTWLLKKLAKLLEKITDLWPDLVFTGLKGLAKGWGASARAGHGAGTARSDEELTKAFTADSGQWNTTDA